MTKTTETTKVVNDENSDGTIKDKKLVTETTTTTAGTTESGKTFYSQIKSKFEQVFQEFIPESLQNNKKVVRAFDDLKDNVLKKKNDKSINPEIEWDAEVRKSNDLC